MISPLGKNAHRINVIKDLFDAHGSRGNDNSAFQIKIENITLRFTTEDYALATYEEIQFVNEENKRRLSSAIFEPNEYTPNGIAWVYLHETLVQKIE